MASKPNKTKVYEYLKHAILTLALPPGHDLDEAKLCLSHQVSRTPLRDVFRRLAGEGYVAIRENRGARVAEMGHQTLRDFFLAAPMIYSAILRLAAAQATRLQIDALKRSQADFKAALQADDVAARALANTQFHEITGQMAGNVYLIPSFQRLLIDHTRISMTFFKANDPDRDGRLDAASRQHDAMIAAIETADQRAAADLAMQHWDLSRHSIAQFVMPDPLEMPLGDLLEIAGG
ncbi:MAG: GntR family transcriptional regulator [Pseudomonadota bacterium]